MIMAVVGKSIRKKTAFITDSIKCALSEAVCSYVLTPRRLKVRCVKNFNSSSFEDAKYFGAYKPTWTYF